MIFESKIFIPSNKRFSTWSTSEKSFGLLCVSIVLLFIPIFILNDFASNLFHKIISYSLLAVLSTTYILSILGPLYEYEPLYGKFSEKITIKENGIIYKNQFYAYQDFKLFDISIKSYHSKRTGNKKFGPKYFQGINNKLYFIADGITFHQYFHIQSEKQSEILTKLIDDAIIEEKIPFRNRYLYLISESSKTSTKYKDFVIKLKNEKRINTK